LDLNKKIVGEKSSTQASEEKDGILPQLRGQCKSLLTILGGLAFIMGGIACQGGIVGQAGGQGGIADEMVSCLFLSY